MNHTYDSLRELACLALTTPSLEAAGALEVLADKLLETGWRTGLVTSERHDPDQARRKFLGHVFCLAWRHFYSEQGYSMAWRLGGTLEEKECWVQLIPPKTPTILREFSATDPYPGIYIDVDFSALEYQALADITTRSWGVRTDPDGVEKLRRDTDNLHEALHELLQQTK